MVKLQARINGVEYELQEADGTTAGDLAEKWAGFVKQGCQTWPVNVPGRRVWVDWSKVASFEVSEVKPY